MLNELKKNALWLAEKDKQIGGHTLLWSNVPANDAKNKNHQEKFQTALKNAYNKIGNVHIIENIIFWNVMACNLVETKLVSIYQITWHHIPYLLRITVVRAWNLTFVLFI